jgi:hypothetical protein
VLTRINRLSAMITRITLAPLLVRCGLFLCALAALLLAYPGPLANVRLLGLLLVAALLPAVAPRRSWTTGVLLAAAGVWVVSTGWFDRPVELWRLFGLATFLYLTHSLAALAGLLSYDAVLAPEVLARWIVRALGVALGAAVLAVPLLAVDGQLGDRSFVVALVGGLVLAVLAAALLGWMFRRRWPAAGGAYRQTGVTRLTWRRPSHKGHLACIQRPGGERWRGESAAGPCGRRRSRRAVRGPASVEEAPVAGGRGHRGRPAATHDVPAVPAGGGGRQHLAPTLRGAAPA